MAVVFQVNGDGTNNEIEVTDAGVVKILNIDVSSLISAASTFVADPSGGGTADTQARTAIAAILDILIAKGLMASS